MALPQQGDDWLGVAHDDLPIGEAHDWAVLPRCGAVVLFTGTVRDHADGRVGVSHLHYEAYEEQIGPRLAAIAAELRARWPELGRIVLLHRLGTVGLTEPSVVVVVSAPHRPEAFAAARLGIDALKASVPIWKRESWAGGDDWGQGAHPLIAAVQVPSVGAADDDGRLGSR